MTYPRFDYTPAAARYSSQPGTGVIGTDVEGGFPRLRKDQLFAPSKFQVQWVIPSDEFDDFMFSFRHTLNSGAASFIIPLLLDYDERIDYIAQIVPNSFKVTSARGMRRTITAKIIALPVEDLQAIDSVVALYGSVSAYLSVQLDLEKLVNVDLPDLLSNYTGDQAVSQLFSGRQGFWYDISDKSTLWQDVSKTVSVVSSGDPVSVIEDKSGNGNDYVLTSGYNPATYQTSSGKHWIEHTGVGSDGHYTTPAFVRSSLTTGVVMGAEWSSGTIRWGSLMTRAAEGVYLLLGHETSTGAVDHPVVGSPVSTVDGRTAPTDRVDLKGSMFSKPHILASRNVNSTTWNNFDTSLFNYRSGIAPNEGQFYGAVELEGMTQVELEAVSRWMKRKLV